METKHITITAVPEPAELFERLLRQNPDPDLWKAAFEATEEVMESAISSNSKEGLIAAFRKAKAQARSFEDSGARFNITTTWSTDVKPNRPTGADFVKKCSPIFIGNLVAGNTHVHRYLCGRIAVEPAYFCVSTRLLLEDINSDLVEVHIYNIRNPSTAKASRMFPVGRAILILEPFFKIRTDMTKGIRVDNPQDIVEWQYPATCDEWKLLGNAFMINKVSDPTNALTCYNAALARSGDDFCQKQRDISTIFTNIGICSFREGNWLDCVCFCGAAVHLDLSNEKAWFWLASSLVEAANVTPDAPTRFAATTIVKQAGGRFHIRSGNWKPVLQKASKIQSSPSGSETWIKSFDGEPAWCIATGMLKWRSSAALVREDDDNITAGLRTMEDVRKRGKILYQQRQFVEAKALYLKALHSIDIYQTAIQSVAIISSNKAAALLTMFDSKRAPEAMLESTVSALLDRTNPKPWLRQARAFVILSKEKMAEEHVQSVILDVKNDTTLPTEVKSNILSSLKDEMATIVKRGRHTQSVTEISDVSTDQQQVERDRLLHLTHLDEYISNQGRMIEKMRMMAFAFKDEDSTSPLFGPLSRRPCPTLHIEFPKLHGWPDGIDVEHATKALYGAYLSGQSHPWLISMLFKMGTLGFGEKEMMKRWHGEGRMLEVTKRSQDIKKGDVLLTGENVGFADYEQQYDKRIRSSFPNSPCHPKMKFDFGSVHVAVGFNDLDCLVSTLYQDSTDPGVIGAPLNFVGIERSEYSIAKSLVIADMLLHESDMSTIFQVWYSSTWTVPTVEAFRTSCQRVLDAREAQPSSDANETRIRSFLHCWLSRHPLPATEARKKWFNLAEKYGTEYFCCSCGLHREMDRVAMVAYGLTGELMPKDSWDGALPLANENIGQSQKAKRTRKEKDIIKHAVASDTKHLVGSLAMWIVPEGSPPFEGENVFNHVTLETLLKELDESNGTNTIVDLFMMLKRKQLEKTHMLLQKGRIIITLKCGNVESVSNPDGLALLNEVAALKPQSMSWSNLMDYFPKSVFHDICCFCSEPGTIHYGYTMNWPTQVYGSCISDFVGKNQKEVNRILEGSIGPKASRDARISGLDRFFTVPLHENPLNLCSYFLMNEVKQKWVDFFGAQSALSNVVKEKSVMCKITSEQTLLQFPFHRTSRSIYLSWIYEEE